MLNYLISSYPALCIPGSHNTTLFTTFGLFHLHICQVCGSYQCPYCPFYNAATAPSGEWGRGVTMAAIAGIISQTFTSSNNGWTSLLSICVKIIWVLLQPTLLWIYLHPDTRLGSWKWFSGVCLIALRNILDSAVYMLCLSCIYRTKRQAAREQLQSSVCELSRVVGLLIGDGRSWWNSLLPRRANAQLIEMEGHGLLSRVASLNEA